MKTLAIVTAAALVACGGGGDDDPAAGLVGKWLIEGDGACVSGLALTDTGRYEADLVCTVDGRLGVETYAGDYNVSGDEITFYTTRSSCADASSASETMTYSLVSGDRLRIASPDGILVFERFDDDGEGGGAAAVYGCFADDGTFTEMPVAELD